MAFAAAEIYARAAELRGAWDARLEALVVDAVLRGETDETVLSRASTLGWHSDRDRRGRGGRRAAGATRAPELEAIRHTGRHRRHRHARRGAGRPDDRGARRGGAGDPRLRRSSWSAGSSAPSRPARWSSVRRSST